MLGSHTGQPKVKSKLSNLVVYTKNKVNLLQSTKEVPLFSDNTVWYKSLPGRERVKILSLTLPATGQLIDAITSLDEAAPVTDGEQAAFRASVPMLLNDLKQFFRVNSTLIVMLLRDEAVDEVMRQALKEEFLDLRARLEGLKILVRGSRETIFTAKDFPNI